MEEGLTNPLGGHWSPMVTEWWTHILGCDHLGEKPQGLQSRDHSDRSMTRQTVVEKCTLKICSDVQWHKEKRRKGGSCHWFLVQVICTRLNNEPRFVTWCVVSMFVIFVQETVSCLVDNPSLSVVKFILLTWLPFWCYDPHLWTIPFLIGPS